MAYEQPIDQGVGMDEDTERFASIILNQYSEREETELSRDALKALATSIWTLADERTPGTAKVRIHEISISDRDEPIGVLEIASDDMPFLVSSVLAQLNDFDVSMRWFGHPVVAVERDKETGQRTRFIGPRHEASPLDEVLPNTYTESLISVAFARPIDPSTAIAIEQRIKKALADVEVTVADWHPMETRLDETIRQLENVRSLFDKNWHDEVGETCSFLTWIADTHFILMGTRDYVRNENGGLEAREGSGLGVLADPGARVLRREGQMVSTTPAIEEFLAGSTPIHITKANVRSNVHRRVYMDYIGVKLFEDGKVVGERRFVGLFTSAAYNRLPEQIPLLRRKVDLVLQHANYPRNSHNYNALANILETFPRDELFQVSVDELFETTTGIMRLFERPRPRIFVRHDRFDRFVSALVYIPRDRYSTEARERIGEILREAYDGRVSAFYPLLGDSPLVRVHFIIGRNIGPRPATMELEVEQRITDAVRSWRDELGRELIEKHGIVSGRQLFSRYRDAFGVPYRESFRGQDALEDIAKLEVLQPYPQIAIRVYRAKSDAQQTVRVKLYRKNELISLSQSLPVFENMGLAVATEYSYEVKPADAPEGEMIWVHDFVMTHSRGEHIDLSTLKLHLEAAFPVLWGGEAEDDGFNRLILEAGLSWREVTIFRAVGKYLQQTGAALSQPYMESTLAQNTPIVRSFLRYFQLRFDPALPGSVGERGAECEELETEILRSFESVQSLDQDRILRDFLGIFKAILRTNYYQMKDGGAPRQTLAFKLDSQAIDVLPLPRPFVEIYVYSPRVEGVHLRFGSIARGGLRWSDRREDFRTEILGLVKAQYVKNSVIVPVGAKGGFVPKRLPTDGTREEVLAEGVACYKLFISSLLDLTDNLQTDRPNAPPSRPANSVLFDKADPYLVVAADKGTATFSDIANEIAQTRQFWLGDAFASGGSNGYDHKAMGITARGAWEAVKRHFREMGQDTQTEPFTVVGVGDMSGDVFGNGMLLSRKIRLVAAFDHRDIFIDPAPDEELSYKERERLFALPRSSWAEYDKSLISEGGGVFSRRAKNISLSPQIQALLGIRSSALPPHQLISAILKADADLMWFGGIGTYIKASDERHSEAGDASNDAVRVDAEDLRVKVIGEGANLGATQRARIAFAKAGGRINSDAIDNAAGVDCSDHEVNIKILLDTAVAQGELEPEARNELLVEMTDRVSELVLSNNYDQTLAVTLAEATANADIDAHGRMMRILEREGDLDRAVEFLPSEDEMAERRLSGGGLTRPEIAVLLAYAKIRLFNQLSESDVPDDGALTPVLVDYFPEVLSEKFKEQLLSHRLRREIIATQIANEIINFGGLTFVNRVREATGAEPTMIAASYIITRGIFDVCAIRDGINALDNKVASTVQIDMQNTLQTFLRRQASWFARRIVPGEETIEAVVSAYRPAIEVLRQNFGVWQSEFVTESIKSASSLLVEEGVPAETADLVCALTGLWAVCDIVDIAREHDADVLETAKIHTKIGAALGLAPLLNAAVHLQSEDHWERLAVRRIIEDLIQQQAALTIAAITQNGDAEKWLQVNASQVSRVRAAFDEIEAAGTLTAARLALAVGHVRDLQT